MESKFIKFKISEVISYYKKMTREKYVSKNLEFDPDDKNLYKDVILEMETKDKYVDDNGVPHNKEVYLNINPLICALIEQESAEFGEPINGFAICKSDHTTSSVFISDFKAETLTPLFQALKKSYPYTPKKYKHNIWDHKYKNANAHLKSVFTGNANIVACTDTLNPISIAKSFAVTKSCVIPIINSQLQLPPCDDVINAEFDYRPDKTFMISLFYDKE